ncbi:hypothetical protein AMTR_s00030p00243270 [Amborella trichopoda]|uniref:Uncharacterized protein n=1 Tax=Amborella trichopoda TaxID=13333 RepID=U5D1T7_AMBTC|nr:hypothetical protein AMTR_s00030p00243270 [Amborella trichopoda]
MAMPLLLFLYVLSPNPTSSTPLPPPQFSPRPLPSCQIVLPTILAPQFLSNLTTSAPQLSPNHTSLVPLLFPEFQKSNPTVVGSQLPDIIETIIGVLVPPQCH